MRMAPTGSAVDLAKYDTYRLLITFKQVLFTEEVKTVSPWH